MGDLSVNSWIFSRSLPCQTCLLPFDSKTRRGRDGTNKMEWHKTGRIGWGNPRPPKINPPRTHTLFQVRRCRFSQSVSVHTPSFLIRLFPTFVAKPEILSPWDKSDRLYLKGLTFHCSHFIPGPASRCNCQCSIAGYKMHVEQNGSDDSWAREIQIR